ncbi:MAG: hypothetical protein A3H67_04270 [Candidatus Buchananbacteria bacterium RIFCSPLOWO2_02_FULL_46_11b]|uniref:Dihydroorotase n=1 Tax=Candidatus Buchananbacteria bacterium RIFCSPLOWO2_02_FULL_46_11b TaxID=1797548 RepID=A0A1G1Z019_9BACT|nr:MAG: hypothetical protein A3H67_04270 [Candidatus Buchananbacteria bacterium RIFCSPLOWO2_02_FULL_46_11b]
MNTITIRKPDDFHVHFREGELLTAVLPPTARGFARAIAMPNLKAPRATTAEHVREYRREIIGAMKANGISKADFDPLMTFKITPQTKVETIRLMSGYAVAGKLYPEGVTTGSEDGVKDFQALYPIFKEMGAFAFVLSIHGELPGAPETEAEQKFIPVLRKLIRDFPGLRIVVEHVSSKAMVDFLMSKDVPQTVGATITPQHLVLTYEDALANRHNYCKPVAKTLADRAAVIQAAISGDPRFFFGSDSAPHPKSKKKAALGQNPAAGVFSGPVALPVLAQVFAAAGQLSRLENFTSVFGARFYRLPPNRGEIQLINKPQTVPEICAGDVVPFLAGQKIAWQIVVS